LILENLSPMSADASSIDSEEYNRLMKELDDEENEDGESSPSKQVFVTLDGVDEYEDDDPQKTPSGAIIPAPAPSEALPRVRTHETPEPSHGRSLKFYEGMSADTFVEIAG
jgi:hypothetical protein